MIDDKVINMIREEQHFYIKILIQCKHPSLWRMETLPQALLYSANAKDISKVLLCPLTVYFFLIFNN